MRSIFFVGYDVYKKHKGKNALEKRHNCILCFSLVTHEAIYLWSVPIVVRTNSAFDRLYTVFPCLVVAAWTDVTAELLDREYEACAHRLRVFHYRYPRFLTNRATISDLLLRL